MDTGRDSLKHTAYVTASLPLRNGKKLCLISYQQASPSCRASHRQMVGKDLRETSEFSKIELPNSAGEDSRSQNHT